MRQVWYKASLEGDRKRLEKHLSTTGAPRPKSYTIFNSYENDLWKLRSNLRKCSDVIDLEALGSSRRPSNVSREGDVLKAHRKICLGETPPGD